MAVLRSGPVSTILSLPDLYRPIEEPLSLVRATMGELWADAIRLVPGHDLQVPEMGGKLLRPALCLLSAGAIGGRDLEQYAKLAAAFESLHVASLAHDDVIDRALLRRGSTALNALWDNHAAVLGGDYLVARAVELLATYGSCDVIANAITSVRRMAEGELLFFGRSADEISVDECLVLAERKTASLFAEACTAATYIVDGSYREPLHQFGIALGIAFQIIDDLLDVSQPSTRLGKPSCGDVTEGKTTLPILLMRRGMSEADRHRLDGFREMHLSGEEREWIYGRLATTGALEKTQEMAGRYTNEALAQLAELPESTYRDAMEGIVDFLLVRTS